MASNKMILRKTDKHAVSAKYMKRLSPCLYVPIAARTPNAIETYVGDIVAQLAPRAPFKAMLVAVHKSEQPDHRLPLWQLPQTSVLHESLQVWVEVDYGNYRAAYTRAFPDSDLSGIVMDHVLNRRLARLKGFRYLRIVPISRATNSSHGGLSEKWAVNHHSRPRQREDNSISKSIIQYADVADIAKMLNLGGEGSFMEGVNKVQELVKLPLN